MTHSEALIAATVLARAGFNVDVHLRPATHRTIVPQGEVTLNINSDLSIDGLVQLREKVAEHGYQAELEQTGWMAITGKVE